MAKTLHIAVVDKVATYCQRDGDIVCGNNDYQISFAFDSEWDSYGTKTARFIWNGKHWDQPFTGNICPVPIIKNTESVSVGVYAGDLSTTTPATILSKRSILCDESEIYDVNVEACRDEAVEAAERAEAAANRAEAAAAGGTDGTTIWQTNRDYSYIVLGGVVTGIDTDLNTIPNKTPKVNDYAIDNLGNLLRISQVVPMAGNLGLGLTMVSPVKSGADGKSAYDIWLEAGNTGSEADFLDSLKGKNGKNGVDGEDGEDYILAAADKAEIAEMVDGATVVQAPKFVNSVAEMTDQSRVYVMASTGRIWAYMDATVEQEVTKRVDIIGTTDNPYETGRLSSGGANSGDVTTHTLTPYIDLTKAEYQGKTIQIHLEGNRYASESVETYIMGAVFDTSKNTVVGRAYTDLSRSNLLGSFDNAGMTLEIRSVTNAVLTFPVPLVEDGGRTVGYFRFCGLGTTKDSVYITYPDTELVTGGQWVDTGTSYTPSVSTEDLNTVAEQAAAIVDNNLLSVIGTGEVSV